MASVHPSAVVDAAATLSEGVKIGPFCVVGPEVELGADVVLHSHVVVAGRTRIGARSQIFPFASLGHRPQDLKYQGESSELVIGTDSMIREHVTMNPGTQGGGLLTQVGNGCLFMVGAHVAHDCVIGDGVIMANNATLAGHVRVDEAVILGGLSAVHQFVRIGRNAMIGGMSGVEHDVPPYTLVMGERAGLHGLNLVGLRRRGVSKAEIDTLSAAYRTLFSDETTYAERLAQVTAGATSGLVGELSDFLQSQGQRALCRPRRGDVF